MTVRSFWANERLRNRVIVAGLLIFAVVYPFILQGKIIPTFVPAPNLNNLIVMSYYAVLALGLNIVVGFAGLLDLGYVAFFVIGAYTTAFLASPHYGFHVPWFILVFIAVGVAALAGVLLGAPTLRLRGDYLAIVTLGFGEIVPLTVRNLGDIGFKLPDFLGGAVLLADGSNLTGGNAGINPIDPLSISLPFLSKPIVFSNANLFAAFYLILGILVLSYLICARLRDSRLGRAWMAIREDETAAAAMGINTVTTKLLAFALGASFSGFAGAFAGAYQTAIFPDDFKFSLSIIILVMVILGGMGSLRGVILGAFAIQYVNLSLLTYLDNVINPPLQQLGTQLNIGILKNFVLHSYSFLIFGVVLVAMMILRPEGLLPSRERKLELHGVGVSSDETGATPDEAAVSEELLEESGAVEEVTFDEDGDETTRPTT